MKQRIEMIAGSLLTAVLTLGSAPAMTAESGSSADGNTSESSQRKISDAKLEQFADAFVKIRSLRAEYASKYPNTSNKAERTKLQEENNRKMKDAIRSTGMEVAEYKRLVRRMNRDKQLQQRLWDVMHPKEAGNSGSS